MRRRWLQSTCGLAFAAVGACQADHGSSAIDDTDHVQDLEEPICADPRVIYAGTVRRHGAGLLIADPMGDVQRLEDGSPDDAFGDDSLFVHDFDPSDHHEYGYSDVTVDPDDRVVVALGVTPAGSPPETPLHWEIMRADANGQFDPAFGDGGRTLLPWPAIAAFRARSSGPQRVLTHDGKIYVLGEGYVEGGSGIAIVRLDDDGQVDPTFARGEAFSGVLLRGLNSHFPVRFAVATDQGLLVGSGDWQVEQLGWDGVLEHTWKEPVVIQEGSAAFALATTATQAYVVGLVKLTTHADVYGLQIERRALDDGAPDQTYGKGGQHLVDLRKYRFPFGDLTFSGQPTDVLGVAVADDDGLFVNVVLLDGDFSRRAVIKFDAEGHVDTSWLDAGGVVLTGIAYERAPTGLTGILSSRDSTSDSLALVDGKLVLASTYFAEGTFSSELCGAVQLFDP